LGSLDLSQLNLIELGLFLRHVRKEKELTLENIADHQISVTTLSNTEKGKPKVSAEKVLYYVEKLGLLAEELPYLMNKYRSKDAQIHKNTYLKLESIAHLVDLKQQTGWNDLKAIVLESSDPLNAFVYYIKGKYYDQNREWMKSRNAFLDCVRTVDQYPDLLLRTNLKAGSLNELSRIAYYEDYLNQAVQYVEDGLAAFCTEGDREYYRDILLVSKAFYLEKLNQWEEVIRITDELWARIDTIWGIDTILNLYEIKIKILLRQGLYSQAIQYTREGLLRARLDRLTERSFDLWTLLGTIYLKQGDLPEAETCFVTALNIKVEKRHLPISTYIELSKLYKKQQKYEKAYQVAYQAVLLGKEINDRIHLYGALKSLGDCLFIQKEYGKAIEPYEEALSIARAYKDEEKTRDMLRKVALCQEHTDKRKYIKCIEEYFKIEVELHEKEE
jgi:tetratricopeptide (TPR) repeat protein